MENVCEIGLDGFVLAEKSGKVAVEQIDQCDEAVTPVGEAGTRKHGTNIIVPLSVTGAVKQSQVGIEFMIGYQVGILKRERKVVYYVVLT